MGMYIPVVEDGVLYNPSNRRVEYSFEAIAIPKQDGDTHKVIWKLDAKTLYGPLGEYFWRLLYCLAAVRGRVDLPG